MKVNFLNTILILSVVLVVSCSKEDFLENEQQIQNYTEMHTAKLSLNCTKQGFDYNGVNTRAASTTNWQDGDKIYLRFTNGATTTQGNAVYNASENTWYINYYGSLTRDKEMSVEVYYFESPESVSDNEVKISHTSTVYHDADAIYTYPAGGDLMVTTTLSPATSRVRFRGEPGLLIEISGLCQYVKYDVNKSVFEKDSNIISLHVDEDGYTPFIDCLLDNNNRNISIANERFLYTRKCPETTLIKGKSGWMFIPTEVSHEKWEQTYNPNWHDYVDLGLPSGLLWATCNIGANSPEEYGDYFAWGEVIGYNGGKTNFTQDNYKYMSSGMLTKYCVESRVGTIDNIFQLEQMDDAAFCNWKGKWRMPTKEDYEELINNCTISFTTFNGVAGFLLTGKNSNTIFFPSSGSRIGGIVYQTGDNVAWYWSATLVTPQNYPYYSYNSNDGCQRAFVALWGIYRSYLTPFDRYEGLPIRACRNKY